MAQPYVGEIRMFAGNFAPAGWMFCDGQLLPISEYEVIFNLIGTTYGGDGQSTFALPDLRSKIPLHFGDGFVTGETRGAESVTLTVNQIPAHTHDLVATTSPAIDTTPTGDVFAEPSQFSIYLVQASPPAGATPANAVVSDGGSQPHDNMHPYVCINYIISLFGIFPSQT